MDPGKLDLESGRCTCHAISNAGGLKPLERRKQKQREAARRCTAHSIVGTPNYIAPEVLQRTGYTQSCDWWSVGIILYEMVIGAPPFHAEDPMSTQYKVVHWNEYLVVPPRPRIAPETEKLIRGLITSADRRLGGKEGSAEIKRHPFFTSIDFSHSLRRQQAPFRPDVREDLGLRNFDHYEDDEDDDQDGSGPHLSANAGGGSGGSTAASKDYIGFYEFTFRRFFDDTGHPLPLRAHGHGGDEETQAATASGEIAADQQERKQASHPAGPVYV